MIIILHFDYLQLFLHRNLLDECKNWILKQWYDVKCPKKISKEYL